VEGVIKEFDVRGPLGFRKGIQALNAGVAAAKGEKAQGTGHMDGIVKPPLLDVGLANDIEFRVGAAMEAALHGRERHGLVPGHHFRLHIAGGKGDQKRMTPNPPRC